MAMIGDSLSGYKGIEFLSGQSPDELRNQLRQIRLPFKIVAMYAAGSAHYAWIQPTGPVQIKKVIKTKTKGDEANGNS